MTLNSKQQRQEFKPVYDGRKAKIKGLWKRGDKYYARLKIAFPGEDSPKVRRISLKATTVASARKAQLELIVKRDGGNTVTRQRTPTLAEFAETYTERLMAGNRKRPETIKSERTHARFWAGSLGKHRLHAITAGMITHAIDKRSGSGASPRTCNLGLTVLRNIYREAMDDGLVDRNPCLSVKWRKPDTKKRNLVTAGEFDRLCQGALTTSKNGRKFVDFIRLLQFSGGRMSECFRLRWENVNWELSQLTIGADGNSKNHTGRYVDFNTSLEDHLKDMYQRREKGPEWLFPSSQRGREKEHSISFRETLLMARKESGLEHVWLHDTRHHFISMSVMAGIDYMTIAAWVGHKDGGILIGKTYGHLANEHRQRAAQKLVLGSVGIIDGGKAATA